MVDKIFNSILLVISVPPLFVVLISNIIVSKIIVTRQLGPNSPDPLTDDWKVMDDSSINFHDVFFFIFCYNLAKNEEKHVMEIYG